MDIIMELGKLIVGLVTWVFLAVVGDRADHGLKEVDGELGKLINHVLTSVKGGSKRAKGGGAMAERTNADIWKGVESFFTTVADTLDGVTTALRSHWIGLRDLFGDSHIRPWRIIGAAVYFAAFIAFFYADLAQAANSVSAWLLRAKGIHISVPHFLQNLLVPILVASAGSAGMLGMIILDFFSVSNFAPWAVLKGKTRAAFLGLALANLMAALILSVVIAMARFYVTAPLSDEVIRELHKWVSFAQSAIFFPMLVTTALVVWWGLAGLILIWLLLVGGVFVMLATLSFFLRLLTTGLALGDKGTAVALSVLFALLEMILSIILLFIRLTETAVHLIFVVVETVLSIVVLPLVRLGEWVSRFDRARDTLKFGPQG